MHQQHNTLQPPPGFTLCDAVLSFDLLCDTLSSYCCTLATRALEASPRNSPTVHQKLPRPLRVGRTHAFQPKRSGGGYTCQKRICSLVCLCARPL